VLELLRQKVKDWAAEKDKLEENQQELVIDFVSNLSALRLPV
jgi:hypothetical protein